MSQNKTERVPVMFDRELLTKVDDYGFDRRIRTRAAAIRELIARGLKENEQTKEASARS